ncbi:MAG: LLM class flavin-dependent oxidoreductase [Acidimicrobiia bacterium]
MQIGLGIDPTLALTYAEQAQIAREAAALGYTSIWTPEGTGEDSFLICHLRWAASAEVVEGGIGTGISVSPVAVRTPLGFAMSAGTLSAITGGKFVLGIGAGTAASSAYRNAFGVAEASPVRLVADYLDAIQRLLAGEVVRSESVAFAMRRGQLAFKPPATPVYIAALGPMMLRLAGRKADGATLNWCSRDQVAWSREHIAEGASAAGRDPAAVNVTQYIRICVDDDVATARRAYAKNVLQYAENGPLDQHGRPTGYRAHFERMGFTEALAEVDRLRAAKASEDEILAAVPDELLLKVGYFGTADGARAHFRDLATHLDTAIVRIVAARPGIDGVRRTMEACS